MASSKQSAAEKKTKSTKSPKNQNGIVTKKRNPEKNHKTANGTDNHSNGFVLIPSSSVESQEDGEHGRSRSDGASKIARVNKPKKGKRKLRKEEVNDIVDQRGAEEEEEEEVGEKEDMKTHRFPMHRIRSIIRSENSDLRVTQEALFVVNKATEKFLEQFTKDAYSCCVADRKKSLAYKHLSSVISKTRRYDFLSDFVPEKIKAENALAERELNDKEVG